MTEILQKQIEAAYENRALLQEDTYRNAVLETVAGLDQGSLRVASPPSEKGGEWVTHAWVKQAVLLYFGVCEMDVMECGPFTFYDKIPLKKNLKEAGVRVVPPGTIRYGAHMASGSVLMPGYVNIGAYVGAGTMVDTWATVGSCAQIGADVHLSGGVGIGGVLEPPGATPVIVEDGAFIGSRAIIVEGARIGEEAVLGANTVITASTSILDVTSASVKEMRGYVPPRSVVIPGTRPKRFPAGEYDVPCALIIGQRSEKTDRKVSLNDALRDHGISV